MTHVLKDDDMEMLIRFERWQKQCKDIVQSSLSTFVFNETQFVSPADEKFGSPWQKKVHSLFYGHIPDTFEEKMWNSEIRATARQVLSRRRNVCTQGMKKQFMGE